MEVGWILFVKDVELRIKFIMQYTTTCVVFKIVSMSILHILAR